MPGDLDTHFLLVEKKILKIKKNRQDFGEKYNELSENYEQLKQKYREERKKNQELEEQSKNIKLQSAISGNPNYNRLMRSHINRLIKEVDLCIAQLQNSGM
jgi:predicted nuclease with TOPRIM domain